MRNYIFTILLLLFLSNCGKKKNEEVAQNLTNQVEDNAAPSNSNSSYKLNIEPSLEPEVGLTDAVAGEDNEISKDDLLPEVKELLNKALAGDADAQLFLGQRYQEGNGVDENKEEAIKWLKLSAEQGNVYAPYILKKMEESAAD